MRNGFCAILPPHKAFQRIPIIRMHFHCFIAQSLATYPAQRIATLSIYMSTILQYSSIKDYIAKIISLAKSIFHTPHASLLGYLSNLTITLIIIGQPNRTTAPIIRSINAYEYLIPSNISNCLKYCYVINRRSRDIIINERSFILMNVIFSWSICAGWFSLCSNFKLSICRL